MYIVYCLNYNYRNVNVVLFYSGFNKSTVCFIYPFQNYYYYYLISHEKYADVIV